MAGQNDFSVLDKVSLALERGIPNVFERLTESPKVALGPVVEAVVFSQTNPSIESIFSNPGWQRIAGTVRAAKGRPLQTCSDSYNGMRWGFIGLSNSAAKEMKTPLYAFQLIARNAMDLDAFPNSAKGKICGALIEMVDNILDHSGAPQTGIVGFSRTDRAFELCIGDAGMGVLASLQTNPTFSYARDAGTAITIALADGNSRFGPEDDRGYGFGTLFRALSTLDAELRFRSGDYAVEVSGRSPTLRRPHVSQKAQLRGFVVCLKISL